MEQSCPVERIIVEGGRVTGVETRRGEDRRRLRHPHCGRLVTGARRDDGARSSRRARAPVRMYVTDEAPQFPERLPLTIDFSTSFTSIAKARRSSSAGGIRRWTTSRRAQRGGYRRSPSSRCATRSRVITR